MSPTKIKTPTVSKLEDNEKVEDQQQESNGIKIDPNVSLQSQVKFETRQVDNITQIVIHEVDEEDRPISGSSKEDCVSKDKPDIVLDDAASSI